MDYCVVRKFICICTFCFYIADCEAQTADYSIHANIVYRFTKYIDWPENKKTEDFVIGVVGNSPIFDELTSLTKNKHVGKQPIVLKRFSANARSFPCHILFISERESGALKKISEITTGKPLLIVSENTGLISRGSCINFIIVGDRLKLEFSKINLEKRNLNIASELLSLGTVIN